MDRRYFLESAGGALVAGCAAGLAEARPETQNPDAGEDRALWVTTLSKIANPLLNALAENRLKEVMPVEGRTKKAAGERRIYTHLEGFARLLSGMTPWLELTPDLTSEGRLRAQFNTLARRALGNAVSVGGRDRLNFTQGPQPLVDAAFLSLALIRAPRLWQDLDAGTKTGLLSALRDTRAIKPYFNNWLLFSGMIETFFLFIGEQYDPMRIDYAVRQHEQWYRGDGVFGDGPEFHWDYYNSYVIQPFLREIFRVIEKTQDSYAAFHARFNRISARYALIQERLIGADGSFPPIGRSLAYRCGAFHHLASESLHKLLPHELSPAQVRCALTASIRKTLEGPKNFDDGGWLTIGLSGHQPRIAEEYISTGSLYLCATAFLPLGLPPSDPFWNTPFASWTARKVWEGEDVEPDAALRL